MWEAFFWRTVAQCFAKYRLARSFLAFKVRPPRQPEFGCDPTELDRFVVFKLLPLAGVFPFPPHELMLLCAAVLSVRPRVIVEWGTHVGTSARIFYECTRHYGITCAIHTIDLPRKACHKEHPGRLRGILVRGRAVTLHEGDGAETCVQILRAHTHTGEKALVFIDGDHARDTVLREARLLWREFPELPILFHDTFPNPTLEGGGPAAALDELLRSAPAATRLVATPIGPPGLTLVQPPPGGIPLD